MAAAQEMTFKVMFETVGEDHLSKIGEKQIDNVEELTVKEQDKLKLMGEQFTKVEKMLAMQKDIVKKAEVMSKLRKDDVDSLKAQQGELLKAEVVLDKIMSTPGEFGVIEGPQLENIAKLQNNILSVDKAIGDALDSTNEWKKALKDVGLDKLGTSAKKLMSIGGQVGFWAGMFKENTRQAALWTDQNYQLYGSTQEVADGIRGVQTQYGLLQKEAEVAAKAVMNVSMAGDPAQINAITGAVGRFTMTTGANVEQAAKMVKQYQILGYSLKTAEKQFKALRIAAANYGITGKDMDVINQYMSKNIHNMSAAAGGSAEKMAQLGKNVVTAGSMAKLAGMDMSEFGEIIQALTDDATKYAVLLEGALTSSDPGAMFLTMGKNAGKAVDSLKGIESHWLKQKIANDTYGMSYDRLVKMDKAYTNLEEATKASGKELEKMLNGEVDLTAAQEEAIEAYRNETDAGRQFQIVMQDLKNIFVTIIGPIVKVAAAIASWIAAAMKFKAVRIIIGILGGLIVALVLLKWVIGTFAILGTIIPLFKRLGGALTQTSKAAGGVKGGGISKTLKSLGTGLRHFFKNMARLSLKGVFKFALAMVIFGGAMVVLGYAASYVPPGKLQELATSLVLFAGAMWITSKILDKAFGPGFWKGVAGMAVLGLVLVGLGYAAALIPPTTLLFLALGIAALAGAMWVLGTLAAPIALGAGALILVAVGLALVGAALLIPSLTGDNLLMTSLGLMALAGSMILFAVASIPFLIGAAATLAAMVVLGAAMLIGAVLIIPAAIFWAAGKLIGSGFAAIFAGLPGGDASSLIILGKHAYNGLWGLAAGINALTASSWFKFWLASEYIGEGLYYVMRGLAAAGSGMQNVAALAEALPQLAAGITAFAIDKETAAAFFWTAFNIGDGLYWLSRGIRDSFLIILFAPLLAVSLAKLGSGIRSFGTSSGFVKAAIGFRTAIRIIGDGLMYYGLYVENAANRVLAAVFKVGMAQEALKWMGLDEIVKSAATVTVKADVEDKKKESEDRLTQSELLEDILTSIQGLSAAVAGLVTGGGAADKVEAVRELLSKYLPEIAEGDSQLSVGNTNQW